MNSPQVINSTENRRCFKCSNMTLIVNRPPIVMNKPLRSYIPVIFAYHLGLLGLFLIYRFY